MTTVLPKSALGKAAGYTLSQWPKLRPGLRLRGSRTVEEPGGELDAAGCFGSEELAARGQRQGWTEAGGNHVDRRVLPAPARVRAGITCSRS